MAGKVVVLMPDASTSAYRLYATNRTPAPRNPKNRINASGFGGVSSFGLWDDAPKSADPCSGAVISVMDPSDVMPEAKGKPPCMTGV
jgi:hypothetical protein